MIVRYGLGMQISSFFRAFFEIFIRTLFPPSELAVWSLIQVISSSFTTFHPSSVAASQKEIAPLLKLEGQKERLYDLRSASISFEVFQQVIFVILVVLVAPYIWSSPENYKGLSIFYFSSSIMAFTALQFMLIGILEASNRFDILGISIPLTAFIQALTISILSFYFGLEGLLIGNVLVLLFIILIYLFLMYKNELSFSLLPKIKTIKSISTEAIVFKFADIPTSLLYMADVFIVSIFFSPKELVIYTTAKFLVHFSSQLVYAMNRVAIIDLGSIIKNSSNDQIDKQVSRNYYLIFFVTIPFSIAIAEPSARFFIPLIINDYSPSLILLPYLMLAEFCSGRSIFLRNYWVYLGEWMKLFILGSVGLIILISFYLLGLISQESLSLKDLALLTALGQLPFAMIIIIYSGYEIGKVLSSIKRAGMVVGSIFVSSIVFYLNGSFEGNSIVSFFDLLKIILLDFIIFSPLFLIGFWGYRSKGFVMKKRIF